MQSCMDRSSYYLCVTLLAVSAAAAAAAVTATACSVSCCSKQRWQQPVTTTEAATAACSSSNSTQKPTACILQLAARGSWASSKVKVYQSDGGFLSSILFKAFCPPSGSALGLVFVLRFHFFMGIFPLASRRFFFFRAGVSPLLLSVWRLAIVAATARVHSI